MFHVTVEVNSLVENAIQTKNEITINVSVSVKNNKTSSMQREFSLESWHVCY